MKPQRRGIEMIFVHASVEARFSFSGNQRSRQNLLILRESKIKTESDPQFSQVRGDSVILVQGTQTYTHNNRHMIVRLPVDFFWSLDL